MKKNFQWNHYNQLFMNKWWSCDNALKLELKESGYFKKREREKNFDKLVDDIIVQINNFPENKAEVNQWMNKTENIINNFIENDDAFNLNNMDKELKEGFLESTKKFIRDCKEFDSKLTFEEIGQAMRNLWIVDIIQVLVGKGIKYSAAVFGYSMLYPYTDNYLDNVNITMNEKREFNNRLQKRLKGEKVENINENERKIYELIEKIEEVFERQSYPKVYESLLQIYEGQVRSLEQQKSISVPYEKDILGISLEKGGASVLADGYLIDGDLSKEEIEFCIGYGFLLQLADDLQDVEEDLKNNHMTVMSQLSKGYKLDGLVNKLINFTDDLIEGVCFNKHPEEDKIKSTIKNNCLMLILFSIVLSKKYFSRAYIKNIEPYLPFNMRYIKNLKRRLNKKFKAVKNRDAVLKEIYETMIIK